MLYSHKGQYPGPIPFRIVLPNGQTRTDPNSFTAEEVLSAGYVQVPYPPTPNTNQILEWNGTTWTLKDKTVEQLEVEKTKVADAVRHQRNLLLLESDWTQVLDAPVDQQAWKVYRQSLRDISAQAGFPFNISWPSEPLESYYNGT